MHFCEMQSLNTEREGLMAEATTEKTRRGGDGSLLIVIIATAERTRRGG